MRMQKRKFRIGELAKKLEVERFVIRFWEKEFKLRTERSGGGQRFYDENDLALFERIKDLLYRQGFTISGAKKRLAQEKATKIMGSRKTVLEESPQQPAPLTKREKQLTEKIQILQEELVKLRQLL